MRKRDPRILFPLTFLAAGSLLTVATLLLRKLARPRPTEPDPNPPHDARPDLPP